MAGYNESKLSLPRRAWRAWQIPPVALLCALIDLDVVPQSLFNVSGIFKVSWLIGSTIVSTAWELRKPAYKKYWGRSSWERQDRINDTLEKSADYIPFTRQEAKRHWEYMAMFCGLLGKHEEQRKYKEKVEEVKAEILILKLSGVKELP